MLFTDSVAVSGTKVTRDGYLAVDARIARTGIQIYAGSEMGRADMASVRVYRPEAEVFSDRALSSFANRPVTNDHPAEMVTADNWRDTSVGQTADTVTRDGDFVRVPFLLMDGPTIKAVTDGKRELSAGYTAEIKWTPGTTPTGEVYDAVMGDITGNHLAIVTRGRAGAACRIGDSWGSVKPHQQEPAAMAETTRSVVVDGVSYLVSDQGAQIIEKLSRDLADAVTKVQGKEGQIAALTQTHTAAMAAKDGEAAATAQAQAGVIAAKDAEIAALKGLTDAAAMDAAIEARAAVVAVCKRVIGDAFDAKGKSIAELHVAMVTKRLGDAAVAGRPAEFFAAAFDTLALTDAAAQPANPLRDVFGAGLQSPGTVHDSKVVRYEDRMAARWKEAK